MNILDYAPIEFKEHLKVLDNTIKFKEARRLCELESESVNHPCSSIQHYVLTGNEGVGIEEAVKEIHKRIKKLYGDDMPYTDNDATGTAELHFLQIQAYGLILNPNFNINFNVSTEVFLS